MELTRGHATPAGTARARGAQHSGDAFSTLDGLHLSSIGLGTDQGEANDGVDALYDLAISEALLSGINVLDTASTHRVRRSERVVGRALREAIRAGHVTREQVFVATKGGGIPVPWGGGAISVDALSQGPWLLAVEREYISKGIFGWGDIANKGFCLNPRFIASEFEVSRQALGVDTIDLYFLDHPECQFQSVDRSVAHERIGEAFRVLERCCNEGRLRYYGVATTDGLRVPSTNAFAHLSLEELVSLAKKEGGESHHFRAVTMPVSPVLPEAMTIATQSVNGVMLTAIDAARRLGLYVFAARTLTPGSADFPLSDAFFETTRSLLTDYQRALQFVRSVPGVGTAIVGLTRRAHVKEASLVLDVPKLADQQIAILPVQREVQP
jgi:aryl-alcohol dehydrogenase-like predicted oxidoreductase